MSSGDTSSLLSRLEKLAADARHAERTLTEMKLEIHRLETRNSALEEELAMRNKVPPVQPPAEPKDDKQLVKFISDVSLLDLERTLNSYSANGWTPVDVFPGAANRWVALLTRPAPQPKPVDSRGRHGGHRSETCIFCQQIRP